MELFMTRENLKSNIFHRSLSVTVLIKKYLAFEVLTAVTMGSAGFLGYRAVQFGERQTLWRNMSSASL
jgi:hypothetical protein